MIRRLRSIAVSQSAAVAAAIACSLSWRLSRVVLTAGDALPSLTLKLMG